MTADNKKLENNFSLNELPSDYQFNGIDIAKFIGAYLICMIHISPLTSDMIYAETINFWLQQCFCRIAVPFYFTVSGFLLFRKIDLRNIDTERIKKYCFKLLRLLGTWTLLLFVGGQGHLWYLGAVVVATVVLTVLLKYKLKYIVLISALFYVIGLLGDTYYIIIKNYSLIHRIFSVYLDYFDSTRNGIFLGLIFVLMGLIFAHKRIVINNKIAFIGWIISVLLLVFEVYILRYFKHIEEGNMYIFLLPETFFLFYFVSHIKLKPRAIYGKIRVIGMLIFYLHLFVKFWATKIIGIILYFKGMYIFGIEVYWLLFGLTIILTTVLAIFIEHMSHKEKFKWLRYLYS